MAKRARAVQAENSRIFIFNVQPAIDGGRFPIKRTVGETVSVSADIVADGHDKISAVVLYRRRGSKSWSEAPMVVGWNDDFSGEFLVESEEPYEYKVAAWIDSFNSWRVGVEKKVRAGQDVESDLLEGAEIVAASAKLATGKDKRILDQAALALRGTPQNVLALLAGEELTGAMERNPVRRMYRESEEALPVRVDRKAARFSAWYELFPRSQGTDPQRSGTFADAERRLPDIAEMGFDIIYLPPIHPIGETKRKGRNNALTAESGDPGSPWAIGNRHGGHKAIEPALGTIEDFRRFVAHARELGIEIALDLAYQCSPDHPYVQEHPGWFRHRPDGSIHYAENPPKKYEDIFPFNFECEDWQALWQELKSVVEYWIEQGVHVFRVDNPHTKPLSFWQWLIAQIHESHPQVIFLSEAFTRPKVKYGLAKLGFTQSYTYFTWRNTKAELTDYVTELTATPVAEYFRPNFFANTPDILHDYLQHGGRPAFQIRFVLAATLSSNYGIYSGFELCDGAAVPGTEEYMDSEKYQIRVRDWDAPGNIKGLIKRVNEVRRRYEALQFTNNVEFLASTNNQLLAYIKRLERTCVIVVVTLAPRGIQEGMVTVSPAVLGLDAQAAFRVHDLLTGGTYSWRTGDNYVRLDPEVQVAHIFEVQWDQ